MPKPLLRLLVVILVPVLTVDPALSAPLQSRHASGYLVFSSNQASFAQQALSPSVVGGWLHPSARLSKIWLIASLVALGTIWLAPARAQTPQKVLADAQVQKPPSPDQELEKMLQTLDELIPDR